VALRVRRKRDATPGRSCGLTARPPRGRTLPHRAGGRPRRGARRNRRPARAGGLTSRSWAARNVGAALALIARQARARDLRSEPAGHLRQPGRSGHPQGHARCHPPGALRHDSLEYVRAAFIGGAIGYVCKDSPRSELLRPCAGRGRTAHRLRQCLGSADRDWLEHGTPPEAMANPDLDSEACRVLRYIALGVPTWRIAEDVGRVCRRWRSTAPR